VLVWAGAYYFMYTSEEWTRQGGWKVKTSKPMTYPENPSWPLPDPKYERSEPHHYFSQNFVREKTALDIKPSTPTTW